MLACGQQQRVALARALVNRPRVLLLDEPLSALDLKLRQQMQAELRAIQRRLGHTFVFVTHDQDEALTLADRIAVMYRGRVEQVGPPEEVYERPRTDFVARFIGSINSWSGIVRDSREGAAAVEVPAGTLRVLNVRGPGLARREPGAFVQLLIRPEKIRITRAGASASREEDGPQNRAQGVVREIVYLGALTEVAVDSDPSPGVPVLVLQPMTSLLRARRPGRRRPGWRSNGHPRTACFSTEWQSERVPRRPGLALARASGDRLVLRLSCSRRLAMCCSGSFARRGTYGGIERAFTGENYLRVFDPIYLRVFWHSLKLAATTALSCLLIGYPMAYVMATARPRFRSALLVLVVVPFWTNFVVRT